MNMQTLVVIVVAALAVVFVVSYLKEYFVKTEGFDGTVPTCTYTAVAIPNAYIPNCSGTASPFICTGYTTLAEAQTACNSVLGCKGITYRLDTAMGLHYTLRSGYVADPTAPVATTMTSFNGESSYVITNLAVCKPNWQEGAAWQAPVAQAATAATPASSVANAAARAAAGPTIAGVAPGGPGMNSSVGTSTTGVTVPGGTMVLTAATNTLWANSMASQPAPLQGGASVTAAGPGAGTGGV
jgi:hypothetical protein